jgi:putative transposase
MPRISRVVAPGLPHHVTQRGNRRQQTFFCQEDYQAYLTFMSEWCRKSRVEIWAYCLMPNHTHLIAVPESSEGLRRAIGEAHKRYSNRINSREGWRGHLWQGRFFSFPLDEHYLLIATRYIELDPVRAGMVTTPENYPYSSTAAHISGRDDFLVKARALLDIVRDWEVFLSGPISEKDIIVLKRHERTGRPLGDPLFISRVERTIGRVVRKQKPGPRIRRFPESEKVS